MAILAVPILIHRATSEEVEVIQVLILIVRTAPAIVLQVVAHSEAVAPLVALSEEVVVAQVADTLEALEVDEDNPINIYNIP